MIRPWHGIQPPPRGQGYYPDEWTDGDGFLDQGAEPGAFRPPRVGRVELGPTRGGGVSSGSDYIPPFGGRVQPSPTREEFDKLSQKVAELSALLHRLRQPIRVRNEGDALRPEEV